MINAPIPKEVGRRELPPWLIELHADMGTLASITSAPGWDSQVNALDQSVPTVAAAGAKAIGVALWGEALMVAIAIAQEVPGLPVPNPGAHPKGFITLTWKNAEAQLELELQQGLLVRYCYVWHPIRFGVKATHESARMRDVIESLRATFRLDASSRVIRGS